MSGTDTGVETLPLEHKLILVTGAARRIGRALALAAARAGADVVLHYNSSTDEAAATAREIGALGRHAWPVCADFTRPGDIEQLIEKTRTLGTLFGLVNSAAAFDAEVMNETGLDAWGRTLAVNLTAPFMLTQAFARQLPEGAEGRVVNILDWRALHPGADHFAYTVSKAALASMTMSMALAVPPRITVNGIALGAILPPSNGGESQGLLESIPAQRWGQLREVEETLRFLLNGPSYITGEIIHVDGGRHLV